MTAIVLTLVGTSLGAGMESGENSEQGSPRSFIPNTSAQERCPDARRGLAFYRGRYAEHRAKMGADAGQVGARPRKPRNCADAHYLARLWKQRAKMARRALTRYLAIERQHHRYHYAWRVWLPDKWQRIGACETGYGRRPGQWTWNSGAYQGAFGFAVSSWDAFVPYADPKAGPYPSEAYLATPRQQYEVALAIWRRYGFSGWGCRGA